jgi:hypothetical protein
MFQFFMQHQFWSAVVLYLDVLGGGVFHARSCR